jgi:hypothetical protein
MIDLLNECQRLMNEAGNAMTLVSTRYGEALAFESHTVLGFVIAYNSPAQLIERWGMDQDTLITNYQLSLRRAQTKAWNTYIVLLAQADATYAERVALSAIEEDLTGTRKIARAGIQDGEDLRVALLPLLPIQNAPRLEAVDMPTEIKLRTTELPPRVVEAFLSEEQEASVVLVLEEDI